MYTFFTYTQKNGVEFAADWFRDHSTGFKPNNRNARSKINDNATVTIFDSITTYCFRCC